MRLTGLSLVGGVILAASAVAAEPSRWQAEWPDTDFSRSSVEFSEIISGGPPKDGIPALSDPAFIPVAQETRLADREPVLSYEPDEEPARAYPIRYLIWHEIVNDDVAGRPIAVTFCPLCNSGMLFDARTDGRPAQLRRLGPAQTLRHGHVRPRDAELVAAGHRRSHRGRPYGHSADAASGRDGKLGRGCSSVPPQAPDWGWGYSSNLPAPRRVR